jgi:glycosyltransferase involved in cell wall biosynthesis
MPLRIPYEVAPSPAAFEEGGMGERVRIRGVPQDPGRLFGILLSFRRPRELAVTLDRLAGQSRRLDRLVVVDNEASAETEEIVARFARNYPDVSYHAMAENLGSAGGIALGMERALDEAGDDDWIVLLDDDDPPRWPDTLMELASFAGRVLADDEATAAAGLRGTRVNLRTCRTIRVPDGELSGAVPVDYLGGGGFPFYRASVVRAAGTYLPDLFFGFSDLEYGLRLRAAGYSIYAHGDLWRRGRDESGRLDMVARPRLRTDDRGDWRRYYELRNLIFTMRRLGRRRAAASVTVTRVGKGLINLPIAPRAAWAELRLSLRGARDGWAGRLGKTLEPRPGRRAPKVEARRNQPSVWTPR